ncbi:hypothetical protein ACFYZ4_38695 [Streptomyces sp. NPDC001513]|uniref:hypothetical protein n=1 Tax=Streptomyces sp. NPDC001513 TaxID=3364580 RepID=UPI0036C96E53
MNGYTYCNGNPITNLDPDGLKYFEGDSGGGFQAAADKVVQVAQKRITQRAARESNRRLCSRDPDCRGSGGRGGVTTLKKKPSTWTNIWTGAVRGYASTDQMLPTGRLMSIFGISGREQANWLLKEFGVEFDENSIESIAAEVLAPMSPVAKGAVAAGLAEI